ncbi:heme exporter protein CcmD [Marichromatium gracile]|uniref:Heme exporter protein D n=3 Tax=Marichromatium TaxID=85076 RepID=W0E2W7_MARPU|nr:MULTISPECIES: heme exporter protein CcmD [Marichromatium]MBO8086915.1 heme exporter protein CcmD [Marichromatium sp.]AHF03574.1 hemagglutination activity protein [Marichromatium purpuratum 984]KXX65345.1 hemagglutination activity protein [Marichromatium gracile]MBK1708394.1 heme exporter protein CcmD [Marichromatium gracile]MCF1183648.1 heme exporter protein CcmD [Marichromatium gracile]
MSDFFAQGGYAFFVWGAYGMTALLLVIEVLQLRARQRTIRARLGRLMRIRDAGANDQ